MYRTRMYRIIMSRYSVCENIVYKATHTYYTKKDIFIYKTTHFAQPQDRDKSPCASRCSRVLLPTGQDTLSARVAPPHSRPRWSIPNTRYDVHTAFRRTNKKNEKKKTTPTLSPSVAHLSRPHRPLRGSPIRVVSDAAGAFQPNALTHREAYTIATNLYDKHVRVHTRMSRQTVLCKGNKTSQR